MKMGIGFDMLLVMALSCIAVGSSYGDAVRMESTSRSNAGTQLNELQIAYGLDNIVVPASIGRDGPAGDR